VRKKLLLSLPPLCLLATIQAFDLLVIQLKSKTMNDLINQIVQKTGIPADKAQEVLTVVAGFVKQKFPAIGGQIDSVLGTTGSASGNTGTGGNPLGDIGGKFSF
jgi:hypothetical protein